MTVPHGGSSAHGPHKSCFGPKPRRLSPDRALSETSRPAHCCAPTEPCSQPRDGLCQLHRVPSAAGA